MIGSWHFYIIRIKNFSLLGSTTVLSTKEIRFCYLDFHFKVKVEVESLSILKSLNKLSLESEVEPVIATLSSSRFFHTHIFVSYPEIS